MTKLRCAQAFTIIELTAVMVIIMILAGLIVSVGKSARQRAMKAKAESMIAALEVAIGMYYADTGAYPPNSDGGLNPIQVVYDRLTNDVKYAYGGTNPISGWRGPYMEFKNKDLGGSPTEIRDSWDQGYWYDSDATDGTVPHNANSFDLWSIGPDGTNNTSDDVTNW